MLDVWSLSLYEYRCIYISQEKSFCSRELPSGMPGQHLQDLQQPFLSKRYTLLQVKPRLLSLEDRPPTGQLRVHAAHSPAVNSFVIMLYAHEQLRSAVLDCDHDIVPGEERLKWLVR